MTQHTCSYWTWLNHTVIWLSIALLLPFYWLYGLVWPVSGGGLWGQALCGWDDALLLAAHTVFAKQARSTDKQ